ncbi:MAG: ATP-grasp domain-containing protein [Winogradskyella sp.]|uniref:ATP-grasp domain-containing protein n=1 Tax=Winogradskyella sp. TaxID=1883156 RepID=UPI002600EC45|nr:ATP-grasp domain-containing protein [Winogradskyella sp.]NRB84282.1 ATP-grasp domain-containing protein [Winogradskyella sp.]
MSLNNEKIDILIPDGENPLLYQVVYCLSFCKDIKVHVISSKRHIPMSYSKYVFGYKAVPKLGVKEWLQAIDNYVSEHNIDLILPIHEKCVENLILHKAELKSKDKLVPMTSLKDYKTAINKAKLSEHLSKFKLAQPKTQIFNPLSDQKSINLSSYPIIAKPVQNLDGQGIKLLNSDKELNMFLETLKSTYVFQEYLEGYDIDCSVLCENGEVLCHIVQRGILYENREFSPAIGIQFLNNNEVLEVVKQLMGSLNWTGIAHIDLRYDNNSKSIKVIEVNGRFWGSMDGALAAGYNFPYLYCLLAKGVSIKRIKYHLMNYYNLKGFVNMIQRKPLKIFDWSFLTKNTMVLYIVKDPLPTIVKYFQRTRIILKNRINQN